MTDLLRTRDLAPIALGTGGHALVDGPSGPVVLPPDDARALAALRTFRPRDVQVAHVVAFGGEAVVARLERLGLLTTPTELLACRRASVQGEPPSTLVVSTCDRPAAIARILPALARALRDGPARTIVVEDASRSAAHVDAVAEIVARTDLSSHVRVVHRTPPERVVWAERLAHVSGVSRDALVGWLDLPGARGRRWGGGRNATLLRQLGTSYVTLDDDALPFTDVPARRVTEVRLAGRADPTHLRPYPDVDAALAAVPQHLVDPVALHAEVLGRGWADVAPVEVCAAWWSDVHEPLMRAIAAEGRVVLTCTGHLGDLAAAGPGHVVHLPGDVRDMLIDDPDAWRWMRRTRAGHRRVETLTVTSSPTWMTVCAGVDATGWLPPFPPVGRNEDGTFAWLLRVCRDDALVGWLPAAVVHAPIDVRAHPDDALHDHAVRFGIGELIPALLDGLRFERGEGPVSRLATLAARLRGMGSLDDHAFTQLVSHRWRTRCARVLDAMSGLDARGVEHAAWQSDLRACRAKVRAALVDPRIAWNGAELGADSDARAATRDAVAELGALMEAWPRLVAAARGLDDAEG